MTKRVFHNPRRTCMHLAIWGEFWFAGFLLNSSRRAQIWARTCASSAAALVAFSVPVTKDFCEREDT